MSNEKSKESFSFEEPWPLYEDREEPWKDYELLLKLEERFDYQYEIADALGTSPPTISYWLDKAHSEHQPEPDDEELKCKHFEVCGNEVPVPGNTVCTVCIDLFRHNTYNGSPIQTSEYDSWLDYINALREEFPEYLEEQQGVYDKRMEDNDDETDKSVDCPECGTEMKLIEEEDEWFCSECGNVEENE